MVNADRDLKKVFKSNRGVLMLIILHLDERKLSNLFFPAHVKIKSFAERHTLDGTLMRIGRKSLFIALINTPDKFHPRLHC